MSPILTGVDELDVEISIASIVLSEARQRFRRCPSGENAQLIGDATAEVDRLLDQRLAART